MSKRVQEILALILAFFIGAIAASFLGNKPSEAGSLTNRRIASNLNFAPEFSDIEFDDRTKYPSMEMELGWNGEVYRCTANPADEERNWLVLMKRDGAISLEKRKVAYGKAERSDFGSFSKMYFAESRSAVLMLTDQGTVKPGPVTTAYLKRPVSDVGMELYADGLSIGDKRRFLLGGQRYLVRVADATLKGGLRVGTLVLETTGTTQIIWYRSHFFSDNIGELEWAGDMDGDGKLDLLFSSYAQNGGQLQGFLFLSSFAVENNLVGFAGFYSARCTS